MASNDKLGRTRRGTPGWGALACLACFTGTACATLPASSGQHDPVPASPDGSSGIFVISETGGGYAEQTAPCVAPSREAARRVVDGTEWRLCTTDPRPGAPLYQRTLDATWRNPALTGVFIRLKWSDIQTSPTTYDDSILLREVDRAIANGKLYSLAIKSGADGDATPAWLFEPSPAGAGLAPVMLDWHESSDECDAPPRAYGDPTDDRYRELYLDMLSHVALVLRQDSARWAALAMMKLGGANAMSAENRLPNGCKMGAGCVCNDQRWAEAGYTPAGLYRFYEEQMARIAQDFPGKTMGYALIQDGFPRVGATGCYMDGERATICPPDVDPLLVGPFTQTETNIAYAREHYGDGVAIAHLGIGPKPDFSDPSLYAPNTGCPLPLAPDGSSVYGANGVGSGCPNKWATDVGAAGGLIYFQTSHAPKVETAAQLDATLQNLWVNSSAAMLEIYEGMAWQVADGVLDPALPPEEQRTLAAWNQRLHERAVEHRVAERSQSAR